MNRFVDEYIESLPDEKREIAEQLREMILSLIPHVQEKLSFKIPFYHYHGMFCYLNEVKGGIDLGLCRGKDLVDVLPQLEQGHGSIRYHPLKKRNSNKKHTGCIADCSQLARRSKAAKNFNDKYKEKSRSKKEAALVSFLLKVNHPIYYLFHLTKALPAL